MQYLLAHNATQNNRPGPFCAKARTGKYMAILRLLVLLLPVLPACELCAQSKEVMSEAIRTVSIRAIAGLQYDVVRFKVSPGARIRLIFTNTTDMGHNLLITRPGERLAVVNEALRLAGEGPAMDYIPGSSRVLWAIPVISPGQADTLLFTAPEEPGAYPYVCTYPGHGFVMYGVMHVTTADMPALESEENVPQSRRRAHAGKSESPDATAGVTHPGHPVPPDPPFLYRAYMEDASPAAIAVRLPHQLSYCWDAGACRLQYAWEGGFVSMTDLWKGKPNGVADMKGAVFFRDRTAYPLRLGAPDKVPATAFLGYRLVQRYPQFHYTLNGTHVYELIRPKADGSGLIRTFRIPAAKETVWFCIHPEDGVEYKASKGRWEGERLRLSPRQARSFTLTMTKQAMTKQDVKEP